MTEWTEAEVRARAERVLTAFAEMDKLHKTMYPRDGGAPDPAMKLRADGLCLGLADAASILAEFVLASAGEPTA